MTKQAKVEVRCTDQEKASWQEAAGGQRQVSAWLRALANTAAEAGGEHEAIEKLVEIGAEKVIRANRTPVVTPPLAHTKTQCDRWPHHRPGVYCGSCNQVIK
jgi:hypothetical protein